MRTLCKVTLVLGVVAFLAGPALAQRPQRGQGGFGGGFGGPAALLRNEGVQKELKLTDEQKDKLKAANEKVQADLKDEFAKLRDRNTPREDRQEIQKKVSEATTKAQAGILTPDQEKRLKQIQLQQQGVAFAGEDVQKTLKLTDDQKAKIKTINEDAQKAMREAFQPGAGFNEETRKKMEEMRKETKTKIDAVLTAEQKKAWKDMTGEPFEVKFEARRPGGAGAGGNRQPRRPPQGQ